MNGFEALEYIRKSFIGKPYERLELPVSATEQEQNVKESFDTIIKELKAFAILKEFVIIHETAIGEDLGFDWNKANIQPTHEELQILKEGGVKSR